MTHKIIVPTDFTGTAGKAVEQAAAIAAVTGSSVTLFHVLTSHDGKPEEVKQNLEAMAETVRLKTGVSCNVIVSEGLVLDTIASMVAENDYDLMVIGTHGFMGIRQKLLGADILKLVNRIAGPVMVVQEDSPVVNAFKKIVLPVSSHLNFGLAVGSVLLFAGTFGAEVHLYSIHKPGFEWPEQLKANIALATAAFGGKGVTMIRVREEQEDASPGYARQTIKYASSVGADALWMMSSASPDYYSFARDYKETLLLNEFSIPVVCVGGENG